MRRPRLTAIACGLGIAWLLACAYAYLFQERLVYYPMAELEGSPDHFGLTWEEVQLRSADGVRLHAWWLPAEPEQAVLLFLHGNAGNVSHRLELLRMLVEEGFSVLILDYRGYGRSAGKPSEQGTYLDARAAWEYLVKERGRKPGEIFIYGRSLGAGVGLWLARQVPAQGLILENAFTSVPDLGRSVYPYLPVRLLARIIYPNLERIGDLELPVLLLRSKQDRLVPPEHSERLYQRAPEALRRLVSLDAGHNDSFLVDGPGYREALRNFVRDFAPRRAGGAPGVAHPEPGS